MSGKINMLNEAIRNGSSKVASALRASGTHGARVSDLSSSVLPSKLGGAKSLSPGGSPVGPAKAASQRPASRASKRRVTPKGPAQRSSGRHKRPRAVRRAQNKANNKAKAAEAKRKAAAEAAAAKAGPLNMPPPNRGPKPNNLSPVGDSGQSAAMSSLMATAGLVGGAALVGGATSYSTGGSFVQGALAGGTIGAGLGLGGAAMISRGIGDVGGTVAGHLKHYEYAAASQNVSDFSNSMVKIGSMLNSNENRKALFGAGAMLGGGIFGGNRSHKRGFNSNRGNSFGR